MENCESNCIECVVINNKILIYDNYHYPNFGIDTLDCSEKI